MSRPVDLIDPTTTIAAAAGKMRDEDVGCLLVGRDDQLFGIVTDRDIAVRALADGRNAIHEPVWTVMSNEVLCCFEDQPVEEAAGGEIMLPRAAAIRDLTLVGLRPRGVPPRIPQPGRPPAEFHLFRRLPVLDREGLLSGIVSLSDVCGGESRKKPWQVTFYKELTDSRGTMHEVPLTTVYVAEVDSEDEAVAAAGRILKEDWCVSRSKSAADGCRVAGGTKSRPFQPRRRPMFARSAVVVAQQRRQRPNPFRDVVMPAR
jgi:CBS domain-containing protein